MLDKEFTTFINAMSAGYHLGECDIKPMNKEEWERFTTWMERKGKKEIWKKKL